MTNDAPAIRRALISVSDKSGLMDFARFLQDCGVEILSTGGTAKTMRDADISVIEIGDHTGFPKSSTVASRRCIRRSMAAFSANVASRPIWRRWRSDIDPIDLIVVNPYPFESPSPPAPITTPASRISISAARP